MLMRNSLLFFIILASVILIPNAFAQETTNVPNWIKNNAGWWASDMIDDSSFLQGIQYLIKEGIMIIPPAETIDTSQSSQQIPVWIKNTAGWWASDQISETEFVNAIQYLINKSILQIDSNSQCITNLTTLFGDDDLIKIKKICNDTTVNKELFSPATTSLIPDSNGKLVSSSNLNSHGFRGEEFSQVKTSNTYRIFMIGGSTMFSTGSYSDETTISGIMQKIADGQQLGFDVEIINAGTPAANTNGEVKMIKQKIVKLQPDLIVMYDGWNDLQARYEPQVIFDNWNDICELGKEKNFDTLFILQPIAGFGNKELTFQEYVNSLTGNSHPPFDKQLILFKPIYEEYAKKTSELDNICNVVDFRSIFDDVKGIIYTDQGHTLEAGNIILAENIFDVAQPLITNNDEKYDKILTRMISQNNNDGIILYILEKFGINMERYYANKISQDKPWSCDGCERNENGFYYKLKEEIGTDNILVGKDLRNENLSERNLAGQDLTGANLSGQDLRNVDLTGTVLRGTDLSNADLSNKDLEEYNLTGSILVETNLSNANLRYTQFNMAHISNVDFSSAELWFTQFMEAIIIDSDFSGNRLYSTVFGAATITDTDFSYADLSMMKTGNEIMYKKIEIDLDKFDTRPDELDYTTLTEKINDIVWGHRGPNAQLGFFNYEIENEKFFAYFYYVNYFGGSTLTNNDFSNSDLTFVNLGGVTGTRNNFDNMIVDCTTVLEGHTNEVRLGNCP